jgi:hypothetical protein
MSNTIQNTTFTENSTRSRDLVLGLLFDVIGYLSYIFPFGVFTDVIWAPFSALMLFFLYRGMIGKIGGAVQFIEELSPGLDFIPTFTISWFYKYYFSKEV